MIWIALYFAGMLITAYIMGRKNVDDALVPLVIIWPIVLIAIPIDWIFKLGLKNGGEE